MAPEDYIESCHRESFKTYNLKEYSIAASISNHTLSQKPGVSVSANIARGMDNMPRATRSNVCKGGSETNNGNLGPQQSAERQNGAGNQN